MTTRGRPTIPEALDLFGLDGRTVSRIDVATAYREAARHHHPDAQPNFKRKVASYEAFIAATEARDVLTDAFDQNRLPRPDFAPGAGSPLPNGGMRRFRGAAVADPEAFRRHLPSERVMAIPVIGPLVMIPIVVSFLILSFGAALVAWPIAIAAVFIREEAIGNVVERLRGILTSLAMCGVYGVLCVVGAVVWSEAFPEAFPYLVAGAVWLAAIISVDEVYCAIWYWRLRRGRGRALVPFEPADTP